MKKKNIITKDATKKELEELLKWATDECAEWFSFRVELKKMLKDKDKKEVKKR